MTRRGSVLIERLGEANAAVLIRIAGGTRLAVPGNLTRAARLKRLLGDDLAVLVVLHFGDSRLPVPVTLDGRGAQGKWIDPKAVARLDAKGWSAGRIARKLGCCDRTVYAKRATNRSGTRENISTRRDFDAQGP